MSVWGISYSTIRQLDYYNKGKNMSEMDVEEARRHTLDEMQRIENSVMVTWTIYSESLVELYGELSMEQVITSTRESFEQQTREQRRRDLTRPILKTMYGPITEQLRRIGTNLAISKDVDECKDAIFQLVADLKSRTDVRQ